MARRKETYIGGGTNRGIYGGDKRGLYSARGRGRGGNNSMRIYSKAPRRWPIIVVIVILVVLFLACIWQFACGGLPFLKANESQQTSQSFAALMQQRVASAQQSANASSAALKSGKDTTITVSAVGDCTLGKDPTFSYSGSFNEYFADKGPAYFFENVLPYTSNDQLTIANCEGAITQSDDIVEKTFNFKGPAEYTQVFNGGSVEAVNLANNHSFDYGTSGYEETKTNLASANITSFGYDRTATYEVNGITIGLFGICELDDFDAGMTLLKEDIANLKKQGCSLVIGVFHWGNEGEYAPAATQVEMAHAAVDAGCDLVLGGHPHVLQGIEYYNQRYICYSLANFCFGGNSNPMDYHTMIFQQSFTFKDGKLVLDDTMRKAARVVPCLVSSTSSYNDYQPTPLTGDSGSSAIEQLNNYSANLAGSSAMFSTALDESGFANVE